MVNQRTLDIQAALKSGDILLEITSCGSFDQIRVLSLRELHLTKVFQFLTECHNIEILFLSNNKIVESDIQIGLKKLKKLRKLDLSGNGITHLPQQQTYFAPLTSLEMLILDQNQIQNWSSIQSLQSSPKLKVLSLMENPLTKSQYLIVRLTLLPKLPHLWCFDENIVTYDEVQEAFNDTKSIRFKSMSSFSMCSYLKFAPNLSAKQHLSLHAETMLQIEKIYRQNQAYLSIQRSYRAYKFVKIVSKSVRTIRESVKKIQRWWRGHIALHKLEKEMVIYFKETGQGHLLYNNRQTDEKNALLIISLKLKKKIQQWRTNFAAKKLQAKSFAHLRGYLAREKINWFPGAVDLLQDGNFLILKEQRYLLKHLLDKQTLFSKEIARDILDSSCGAPEYTLMREIELTEFEMPRLPVLQISYPATKLRIRKTQRYPQSINQGQTIFGCMIRNERTVGDRQAQDLDSLLKHKQFFKHQSWFERRIGQGQDPSEILNLAPNQSKNVIRTALNQAGSISTLLSAQQNHIASISLSTSSKQSSTMDQEEKLAKTGGADQRQLYSQILKRRKGDNFLRVDIRRLTDPQKIQLLRFFHQHNKDRPINSLIVFFGPLLEKQCAILKIQSWWRVFSRTRRLLLLQEQQNTNEMARGSSNSLLVCEGNINELNIFKAIKEVRAVVCIQQYWKWYLLRRRIRLLTVLRDYISRVNDRTLYIEENLYLNIKEIEFRQMCKKQILESAFFAFDFAPSNKVISTQKDGKIGQIWDLAFTDSDQSGFTVTRELRERELALRFRFMNKCVPDWVVGNDLRLSRKNRFLNGGFSQRGPDRNNLLCLFHKTQPYEEACVLDYNQIVPRENRTFNMSNGLRFVQIKCCSVDDARRRALALALKTLDWRKGEFLQLLTEQHMKTSKFLKAIKVWWENADVEGSLPHNYMQNLLTFGGKNLETFPLQVDQDGLTSAQIIVSKKDEHVVKQERHMSGVLCRKQRLASDIQCQEVNSQVLKSKIVPKKRTYVLPNDLKRKIPINLKKLKVITKQNESFQPDLSINNSNARNEPQIQDDQHESSEAVVTMPLQPAGGDQTRNSIESKDGTEKGDRGENIAHPDDYNFALKGGSVAETMPSSQEKIQIRQQTPSASQDNQQNYKLEEVDSSNMTSVMSSGTEQKIAKKPTFNDKRESQQVLDALKNDSMTKELKNQTDHQNMNVSSSAADLARISQQTLTGGVASKNRDKAQIDKDPYVDLSTHSKNVQKIASKSRKSKNVNRSSQDLSADLDAETANSLHTGPKSKQSKILFVKNRLSQGNSTVTSLPKQSQHIFNRQRGSINSTAMIRGDIQRSQSLVSQEQELKARINSKVRPLTSFQNNRFIQNQQKSYILNHQGSEKDPSTIQQNQTQSQNTMRSTTQNISNRKQYLQNKGGRSKPLTAKSQSTTTVAPSVWQNQAIPNSIKTNGQASQAFNQNQQQAQQQYYNLQASSMTQYNPQYSQSELMMSDYLQGQQISAPYNNNVSQSVYDMKVNQIVENKCKIQKERAISQIIKESIWEETQQNNRNLATINRQEKQKQREVISGRKNQEVFASRYTKSQRAQSSFLKRSAIFETKNQVRTLTGLANMMNKIGVEKITRDQKKERVQTAKLRIQEVKNQRKIARTQAPQQLVTAATVDQRVFLTTENSNENNLNNNNFLQYGSVDQKQMQLYSSHQSGSHADMETYTQNLSMHLQPQKIGSSFDGTQEIIETNQSVEKWAEGNRVKVFDGMVPVIQQFSADDPRTQINIIKNFQQSRMSNNQQQPFKIYSGGQNTQNIEHSMRSDPLQDANSQSDQYPPHNKRLVSRIQHSQQRSQQISDQLSNNDLQNFNVKQGTGGGSSDLTALIQTKGASGGFQAQVQELDGISSQNRPNSRELRDYTRATVGRQVFSRHSSHRSNTNNVNTDIRAQLNLEKSSHSIPTLPPKPAAHYIDRNRGEEPPQNVMIASQNQQNHHQLPVKLSHKSRMVLTKPVNSFDYNRNGKGNGLPVNSTWTRGLGVTGGQSVGEGIPLVTKEYRMQPDIGLKTQLTPQQKKHMQTESQTLRNVQSFRK